MHLFIVNIFIFIVVCIFIQVIRDLMKKIDSLKK